MYELYYRWFTWTIRGLATNILQGMYYIVLHPATRLSLSISIPMDLGSIYFARMECRHWRNPMFSMETMWTEAKTPWRFCSYCLHFYLCFLEMFILIEETTKITSLIWGNGNVLNTLYKHTLYKILLKSSSPHVFCSTPA